MPLFISGVDQTQTSVPVIKVSTLNLTNIKKLYIM